MKSAIWRIWRRAPEKLGARPIFLALPLLTIASVGKGRLRLAMPVIVRLDVMKRRCCEYNDCHR